MLKLFIADMKMMVRNRQSLFWMLMFPLIFTFIFGMFFGKDNAGGGTIAVINHSDASLAQSVDKSVREANLFKISGEKEEAKARDLVQKNQLSALLIIPERFGDPAKEAPTKVKIIYDPANATSEQLLAGYVNSILTQSSFALQQAKPIFGLEEERTNTRKLNYFDFILIGLIGMALMNSSIQGVAISLSKYREDKIFKRITITPLPVWQFILAEIVSRLILNFVQVSLILIVGIYLFGAHIYGNIAIIYLFALIGALLFQAIGFAVASLTKTTQAAEGMATAITVPMMFLTGVFFPIDQLPKWLYSIVQYLPLAPLLRIIRGVGLEAASPMENPINLVIVVAWIVVVLTLAIGRFRLAEE